MSNAITVHQHKYFYFRFRFNLDVGCCIGGGTVGENCVILNVVNNGRIKRFGHVAKMYMFVLKDGIRHWGVRTHMC